MNDMTIYRFISEEEKEEMDYCIKFQENSEARKELLNSFDYGDTTYYNDPKSRRKHFFLFKEDLIKYKKVTNNHDSLIGKFSFPQSIVKNSLGIGFYPEEDFFPIEVAIKSKDIKTLVDYDCPKYLNASSSLLTEYANLDNIFKGYIKLDELEDENHDLFYEDIKDIEKELIDLYYQYQINLKYYKKGEIELDEVTSVLKQIKSYFSTYKKDKVMEKILIYK